MNLTSDRLIHSDIAQSCGFDNTPPDEAVCANLQALIDKILIPVHNHFGGTLDITSGYRCPSLNEKVGSSENSQHCTGQAVDFGIIDMDIYDIARYIRDNLDFDQLVMENRNPDDLNRGWVHVSYCIGGPNRKHVLTVTPAGRFEGLVT